jgi:hypothetical protein
MSTLLLLSAEHPGVGAQGIMEKAGGAGGVEALAVGRVRFPLTLGRFCSLRLLPSGAAGRAQQSAVICREG